jgi:hypothetical protein
MRPDTCRHIWEMVNMARGLIVMKKCFHCGKVSACFCFHHEPPLEECHEGEHFWNFTEGDPTFHFDLKCTQCGTVIKLDELVGLMMCTGCDPACQVDVLRRELASQGIRTCIALGRCPDDERKGLDVEKISVLQEYFDQQRESSKCRIRIVPHQMIKSVDNCYAEVVADADSLFVAAANEK